MALQLLIDGVDRIGYLERNSLRINQDAATYVSTCFFNLIDPNNVITATIKDTLVVEDPVLGEVYFDGTVANVDFDPLGGGTSPKRKVKIQCQDNNILIEEAIVVGPHSYVGVADNAIIAALFGLYLPAIDSVINVNLVDGAVTIDFQNISLREALRQLCDQTEAFWFVREDDLYYGVEADFGLVGWFLSDTPDDITSFGYMRDTSRKYHGSNMVNEITVIGILDAAGGLTRQDAASILLYGTHAAITTDNRISTVAGANKRGDAILNEWSMPRESYTVKTMQGGAIAGQRIRYVNSVYGIDDTFTIRRLSISFPADTALYTMSLGDDLDLGLLGQRIFLDKVEEALEPIEPSDLPLGARGWAHNLTFVATDFDTLTWGGGFVYPADSPDIVINGGSYDLPAAGPYYIYLDATVPAANYNLLATDDASIAIGGARFVLIAVCHRNAAADVTKDCVFQVFGGEGQGVFIYADDIAANTITGNEISANSIDAGHIVAGAVIAGKIAADAVTTNTIVAGAVTADKLQIGSMFFTDAEGLLLLGPHCYIATDEWRSLQGQPATIAGAFHQEAGRWIDTRGLVIEVAATNLITNPSFETDLNGWAGTGATNLFHSQVRQRIGDYVLLVDPAGAGDGAVYICTATTAAATEYTLSVWVYAFITQVVRLSYWDAVTGIQNEDFTVTGSKWTRIQSTRTFGAGAARNVYVLNMAGSDFCMDAVQLEQSDYATTYLDGSLGSGYTWTGVVHASTSTRAVTTVNLDDQFSLITSNDTLSFRLVAQMPYDATGTWPAAINGLFDTRGANDNNRILLVYSEGGTQFTGYINGGYRLFSAVQTFNAGDWIDIVLTIDFTSDEYYLYVNGVEVDDDTTVLAAPALTTWQLGAIFAGTLQAGCTYAEYAVFDKVLTAEDVAQLYNLQRPLVDAGAYDSPGIYIYDGRFRIASSTTGNRIEITPEEIAGYDSAGVKQFYLESSTGVASCGGGKVWLDSSGINLQIAAAPGYLRFWDGAIGRGYLYSLFPGGVPQMYLRSGPGAAPADTVELALEAMSQDTTSSWIRLYKSNVGGGIELIPMANLGGRASYNAVIGKGWFYSPHLSVEDGITAPATIAGKAHIYVDSADGDLKVKFGDGFVRTIAVDS